jgi:exodeoxyribonuclease VII large subunit
VLVHLSARRTGFENLCSRLQSLSPLGVLQRGFAVVLDENGTLVRSVDQVVAGSKVQTRLSNGSFSSTIGTIAHDRTGADPGLKKKGRTKHQ